MTMVEKNNLALKVANILKEKFEFLQDGNWYIDKTKSDFTKEEIQIIERWLEQ